MLYRLSKCRVFVVDDGETHKLGQLSVFEINLKKRRNIQVRMSPFPSNVKSHLSTPPGPPSALPKITKNVRFRCASIRQPCPATDRVTSSITNLHVETSHFNLRRQRTELGSELSLSRSRCFPVYIF